MSSSELALEQRRKGAGPTSVLEGQVQAMLASTWRVDESTCARLQSTLDPVVLTAGQAGTSFAIGVAPSLSSFSPFPITLPPIAECQNKTFRFELRTPLRGNAIAINILLSEANSGVVLIATLSLNGDVVDDPSLKYGNSLQFNSSAQPGDWIEVYGLTPNAFSVRGVTVGISGFQFV